jgi:hypothetical protein
MTLDEARAHYKTIRDTLAAERINRQKVLQEPRRSQAVREIDNALASLVSLASVFQAAHQAGILESVPVQKSLLEEEPTDGE